MHRCEICRQANVGDEMKSFPVCQSANLPPSAPLSSITRLMRFYLIFPDPDELDVDADGDAPCGI